MMNLEPKKKLHGNKKIRVNTSLDQDTHEKLKKLAVSCDMAKTVLAYEIIKIVTNHPDFINFLQNKYNKEDQYRVVPIQHNGKITY